MASHVHKQTFYWIPPITYLAIFICLPIYIILLLILRKQMTVSLPVCDTHRRMWIRRLLLSILGGVGILGGIFSAILSRDFEREIGIPGAGVYLLVGGLAGAGLCFLFANIGFIRPTRITNQTITLKGFSPIFVDTVEKYRILLDDDEDDEDEPG
ncbi:MAG: hypothetical protein U0798_02565 [Gemmataceae bacterium]